MKNLLDEYIKMDYNIIIEYNKQFCDYSREVKNGKKTKIHWSYYQ